MADVILYTTPTCPFCTKAKIFLEKNGIDFEEVNVAMDRGGLKEMREKSGQMSVPVLDVKGTVIVGFNREKINNALNNQAG